MASWEIFLFGTPLIRHGNKTLGVSRRKTLALLAYLVANPRPHSREALATLMWPEHDSALAKANLRRDLSRLKNILDERFLVIDRSQVSVEESEDWSLDTQIFQEHIQLIRSHNHFPEQHCSECLKAGREAVALYTADFMSGFTLPDSPEYDDWQFFTRESLRQSLAELLQRLLAWHTRLGEYEQAIEYGRRWLLMDQLDEHAHRELMRLYTWSGQQAAAIRQYQECVRLLDEELGVEPQPETAELYEAIASRRLESPVVEKPQPKVMSAVAPDAESEGRYEQGKLMAQGGHGEVYLGYDRHTGQQVVIKRIKPELLTSNPEILARFRQEGEILARLNHPNIVRMVDTFQEQAEYQIVMEYVPGGSLRHLLERDQQLEPEDTVALALELADALGRAHHLNIIHRDLKPENILIAEDGTPRLTDFGVAHLKRADSGITRTGTILGSPNYISPEIIQDEEIDGRSDIWSLGVVMYEMLTGHTPFESSQIVTILYNIVNEQEPALLEIRPDLPQPLINLVHAMLHKDRSQRPASMRQVAAVLEAIKEGRATETPLPYLTPVQLGTGTGQATSPAERPLPPHSLPHQTTSFIGRQEELAKIRQLLVEEESCRLLSLVGPGGIGKTRLAIEAAYLLLDDFPDGVFFVPLASVMEVSQIVPAIAEALQLQFSGPAAPKAQLIHFLRGKKLLIVADHLEQLLDGGQVISDLLRLAPTISFMITIRERLQRTEEWSYVISGLSVPEATQAVDQAGLESFSAVQLFLKRANRARADFSLSKAEIPALLEICRTLDCMPLAIELTAPWVRLHTVKEIANIIEKRRKSLLLKSMNDSSEYLSLKAVFQETWSGLTETEQETLQRLTVFHSGCTRESADEVAGASFETLNSLLDKALIQQDDSGRYDLHNLIHELASEAFQKDPDEADEIFDIHCRHYLSFLEQQTPSLKIDPTEKSLDAVTAEADNIRAAWKWALDHRLIDEMKESVLGYWLFHQYRGLWYEGETLFRHSANALINAADLEENGPAMEYLAGLLKVGQGDLMARRGWLNEGINEIEVGLELLDLDQRKEPLLESIAMAALGVAQMASGNAPAARISAQQSFNHLPKRSDPWHSLVCLELMGDIALNQGQLDTANDLFRACLDICDQLGEQRLQLIAKLGMSRISRLRGRYGRSQQWLDESLDLSRVQHMLLYQADILREMGVLALDLGATEQAMTYLEESKSLSSTLGRQDGGRTVTYLGYCYQQLNELDKADDYFRQGLAIAKGANYDPGIALASLHIGLFSLERDRPQKAEQYLQDALAIWKELEYDDLICRALQCLGDAASRVGEPRAADARSYYYQALEVAVRHRLAPIGLQVIVGLVPLLVHSGELHRALRLLILAEQHPASTYQTKQDTARCLTTFPEDEITAVRRETVSLDWIETAENILAEIGTASWGQTPVHHNLPVHRSAFFGRQRELEEIEHNLLENHCRLISITGPGGIGKTRLALAAAAAAASHFPQGVFLIPLAPLESAEQIYLTMAEILEVQNLAADNVREQLLNYLKRKRMLFIFDNYEHLLPQVDFIAEIINTAPEVQIIVTTRQRLNLGPEIVYTLKGMAYPALSETDPDQLATYDAVQLLVDQAQLARPDIRLEPEDYEPIIRICNLVQGMPLALVLAASWLDMLSFAEIANEIETSLDFLESERGDLPGRQRSVRAVFNGSWSRLPSAAQATFARLSVFRGGFSREAAGAVCKTSLRDLRTLVNSSFVTVSTTGRYEVHELMRQLGAEQLVVMGSADQARTDHSNYYLSFLHNREADLRGMRQIEALEEILEDFDNVRSAWNWALEHNNRTGIDQAQECLHLFFDFQGRYGEGRDFFRKAKKALAPPADQKPDSVYGRILTRYAFLGVLIGRPRDAILVNLEEGMAIAETHGNQLEIAINYLAQGSLLLDLESDLEKFFKAKAIFEDLQDNFYLTRLFISLSGCYGEMMNREKADFYTEEAVRLSRKTGSIVNLSLALANLAEIELSRGQYEAAQDSIDEARSHGLKIHAWLLVAYSYILSALNRFLEGNMAETETDGQKSLAWAEELDHAYLKAISMAILSLKAGLQGETVSGLEWAKTSNSIPENNLIGLVLAPWALSINEARLGHWQAAEEALVAALKQAIEQEIPAPAVWLIGWAALPAVERGEYESAVRFLSLAKNHPISATGWMAAWPRLANLEIELRELLEPEIFDKYWTEGKSFEDREVPPQLIDSVYDLFGKA